MTELCQGKMRENFKKIFNLFFLLSSVFPKTHKSTFKTFYFNFHIVHPINSLQFDIYFVRVIFQTHIVMCSYIIHHDILCVNKKWLGTTVKILGY